MYVRNVRTLNWMAFAGEQRVGPLPPGSIAVVGRYVENARRSNWSGKTAWLEAIRFALTGAHRKRLDDALITHGADRMEVELEMSTGLVVTRSLPRGGPMVLRVSDGAEKFERDAAEAHLVRVIRLPVDDFDNTSWFGQGDVQALCGKTSGVRRATFARWLELDMWERMGARAGLGARESRASLENARRADNGPPPRTLGEINAERDCLRSERLQVGADRDQVAHELEQLAASSALVASVAARRGDSTAAVSSLQTIRDQLVALAPADAGLVTVLEEVRDREQSALTTAEKELVEVGHLLGGRFDGQCPVTCEACPVSDEVSGKRAAFVERNRVAKMERDRARGVLTTTREALAGAARESQARVRLVGAMNVATQRVRDARHSLEEALSQVDDQMTDADARRASFRTAAEGLDARLREIDAGIGRCDQEVRHAERYAQQEAARVAAISRAERDARISQLVARALGGSGIPARIAAVSLAGLEARANALLAGLGLSFALTWERELADPAPACAECGHVYEKKARARECPSCGAARSRKKSDELDVLVDDGSGEVEDVRAKSGGAKVLVASAIRLAGGMMLRERRGSPLEVAFVDEPFGELDLENRDALARTFAGLLSSVGLEQAFVVSHDAQLLSGLPARIVVTRDGSTSRLELEA